MIQFANSPTLQLSISPTLNRVIRLKRHPDNVRVVHAKHRFLIELLLVERPDSVDLPAAPAEAFERIEEDEHERPLLDDNLVFARELTVGFQEREAVGKMRRNLLIDELLKLFRCHHPVGPGGAEKQLGPGER